MIISIICVLVYALFIIYVASRKRVFNLIKQKKKTFVGVALASIFFGALLIYVYFSLENTIYVWDEAGYYKKSLEVVNLIKNYPSEVGKHFVESLGTDYSLIIAFVISPFIEVFGNSFMKYVLINYVLFIVPFQMMVYTFILIQIEKYSKKKITIILPAIFILLFITPYFPLLFGYADSIGLVLISGILLIHANNVHDSLKVDESVVIGITLLSLVLLRRWYAFYVVAYFVVNFAFYSIYYGYRRDFSKWKILIVSLFISGCIALMLLTTVFNSTF